MGRSPPPRDADKPAPSGVRKVRNEHGTRVARAIVCASCGSKDTVDFAPRNADRALCRRCAADILGIVDEDAGIRPEWMMRCTECGRQERTASTSDDPFKCKDCMRGIWSQQKDRGKTAERLGDKGRVLRIRKESGPHE